MNRLYQIGIVFVLCTAVFGADYVSNRTYITEVIPSALQDGPALRLIGAGTLLTGAALLVDRRIADITAQDAFMPEKMSGLGDHYISKNYFAWSMASVFIIKAGSGNAGYRDLRFAGAAMFSTITTTYTLKRIFNRKRPSGKNYSFPSGHTSVSFAAASVIHELYDFPLSLPFWTMAAVTGLSRINDGAHYPADVIFGASLGISIPMALYHSEQKVTRNAGHNIFTFSIPINRID